MSEQPKWEEYDSHSEHETYTLKVNGGTIFHRRDWNGQTPEGVAMCFVPDVDLTRYQAHLRDAYNQGFKDGHEHAKAEPTTEL